MVIKTLIRKNEYRDSVQLMQAASSVLLIDGVENVSIMMGTPNNKTLFADSGLLTSEVNSASPNDIVMVIKAKNNSIVKEGFNLIEEKLTEVRSPDTSFESEYRSTRGAIRSLPNSNLITISVSGEYAARETKIALEAEKNVFLFSDNVSIDDEIELKKIAQNKGLLLMGPDCGTSIIKGIGIGFANKVQQGSIGIVGASGTGIQEVTSLIHQNKRGISHAIGTGSRDVKDKIGGITTLMGLDALDKDLDTKVIVIVSKPAEKITLKKILTTLKTMSKPVVVNFIGFNSTKIENEKEFSKIHFASTLEDAAIFAVAPDKDKEINQYRRKNFGDLSNRIDNLVQNEIRLLSKRQQYIRALYAGGTFTFEANVLLADKIDSKIFSNVLTTSIHPLSDINSSVSHTIIDLGDDIFTQGKPHPMIDQTYRKQRILEEADDPTTAVILLDFVLGFGAHPDPIGDILETIRKIRNNKNYISIVAHICGTDLDSQDYNESIKKLQSLNVIVMPTNAQAVRMAALIALRETEQFWGKNYE